MVTWEHHWNIQNTSTIFRQILRGSFTVPPYVSAPCKGLIANMMQADPAKRIVMAEILKRLFGESPQKIPTQIDNEPSTPNSQIRYFSEKDSSPKKEFQKPPSDSTPKAQSFFEAPYRCRCRFEWRRFFPKPKIARHKGRKVDEEATRNDKIVGSKSLGRTAEEANGKDSEWLKIADATKAEHRREEANWCYEVTKATAEFRRK
jgi:hypothetical protein